MVTMIIPKLCNGQYALFMADGLTGHVLTVEGKVSIDEKDQIFIIFESSVLSTLLILNLDCPNN